MIIVTLKKGKEQSVLRFHPWIFSGAIHSIEGTPGEGDVVEVYSNNHEFLALGHYQVGSIAVRLFSFHQEEVNEAFWKRKILNAFTMRQSLGFISNPSTDVYRLIHGEGDLMPGLIVDIYGSAAVMQAHSVGMYLIRGLLANAIVDIYGGKITSVYDKSEGTVPFKANLNARNGDLIGKSMPGTVTEYGNKFRVDWINGQKTGFFIDQRENRKLVEQYAAGRDVLNTFGYTGGFSVYALRGGAKSVHSVDSSEQAITMTDENVALNFSSPAHESFATDAFHFLQDIDQKYDLIILDPPAFAKHQKVLQNALQGYKKLNARAISQIRPGGVLFTFSCSQVVSRIHFREAVFSAAAIAKRQVRILHQLSQPADHPVSIFHPEGEYLKGLVLYVE